MAVQTYVSLGLLIVKVLRSHSDTPYSIGLLWKSDQPDAQTMHPAGFKLAILASEWPQDHVLDQAATGIGRAYRFVCLHGTL